MDGSSSTLSTSPNLVDNESAITQSVRANLKSVVETMRSIVRTLTTDVTLSHVGVAHGRDGHGDAILDKQQFRLATTVEPSAPALDLGPPFAHDRPKLRGRTPCAGPRSMPT
jgi:hypothetical protein